MDLLRVSVLLTILSLTLGVVAVSVTGQISPFLQISAGSAILSIVGLATIDDLFGRQFYGYLASLLAVGIVYRALPLLVLPGLIGMDPHWYAVQTQAVIDTGSTDPIQNPFYEGAAGYIVYLALIAEILGVQPERAILVLPLILGIVPPLVGAIITERITRTPIAALTAAALLVVVPSLVRGAFWPTAQSFATALFAVFLLLFLRIYRQQADPS
ncbi:hypothetical protein [Natrinema sp. SYSU A 869]|uniref:hypothetical protein n=1 Tax=Natrinema sp. SYSU A 869 TaxID=2871694 RepID=UPI001CA3B79D|nr:hypothetical protein [Natrinema sp. SYSU A 869]